ncbi:MAG: hypothetical protein R3C20_02325 [Planctomycetaceae bacterium]
MNRKRDSKSVHSSCVCCVLSVLVIVANAGCKYDGSFLQMNSDSPTPFMGFQLSVRNERSQHTNSTDSRVVSLPVQSDHSPRSQPFPFSNGMLDSPGPTILRSASAGSLVPVSVVSEYRSHVRFSIPSDSDSGVSKADEVQLRLNGF